MTFFSLYYDHTKGGILMKTIGNIIWFLFGGFLGALMYFLSGIVLCVTIIGIPVGRQCFKFARLSLFPFGKEIIPGESTFSFLVNVLWLIFFGAEIALSYVVLGLLYCVTIIGIPFGKQCFKLAKLALCPFGAQIV